MILAQTGLEVERLCAGSDVEHLMEEEEEEEEEEEGFSEGREGAC